MITPHIHNSPHAYLWTMSTVHVCSNLTPEATTAWLNDCWPRGTPSTWEIGIGTNGALLFRPCEKSPTTHAHYLFRDQWWRRDRAAYEEWLARQSKTVAVPAL